MAKYKVLVPELHYQTVEVEAPTEADAVREVMDYGGDRIEGSLEYSHVVEEYLNNLLEECERGDGHFLDWMIQEVTNDSP
jgi:hypothetical protein